VQYGAPSFFNLTYAITQICSLVYQNIGLHLAGGGSNLQQSVSVWNASSTSSWSPAGSIAGALYHKL